MIFVSEKKNSKMGNFELNFDLQESCSILKSYKSICPSIVFFFVLAWLLSNRSPWSWAPPSNPSFLPGGA